MITKTKIAQQSDAMRVLLRIDANATPEEESVVVENSDGGSGGGGGATRALI